MKCRWCKNGKNCGCSNTLDDPCEHYGGTGEVTDPPFGAPSIRNVLAEEDVNVFAEYWCDRYRDENLGDFIQRVAQHALDKNLFTLEQQCMMFNFELGLAKDMMIEVLDYTGVEADEEFNTWWKDHVATELQRRLKDEGF